MFKQTTIEVNTNSKKEIQDITHIINNTIKESGQRRGLVNIVIPHTTACLTLNESDPNLWEDILRKFGELVDPNGKYKHQPNADSHILSSIIKSSVTVPLEENINLGTYQRILLIELDGPRKRKITVTILSPD